MKNLFDLFSSEGYELYFVGGCVRDFVLGIKPNDIDFATNARPEQTCALLQQAGLPVIPIGIEFGTIQTIVDGEKIEITTFRCNESYSKGCRKPSVVFGNTLEGDLIRRDFTINALAKQSNGSVVDLFGGLHDLERGIIRTPTDPAISFIDDPLRILRASRFVARGFGVIHPDTAKAMHTHRDLVNDLSVERVFEEMTKLLMASNPVAGLRALVDTGVLPVLFPELVSVLEFKGDVGKWHHLSVWEHTLEVVRNTPAIEEVRWAALFHDAAKPECWSKHDEDIHFLHHDERGAEIWDLLARRLKVSNKFRVHVGTLIREHQCLRNEIGNRGVRRLIHRLGECLDNLFLHTAADIKGHSPHIVASKLAELSELRSRVNRVLIGPEPVIDKLPHGTGNVIAEALGIKPGVELGVVMKHLQQLLVDGEITAKSDLVEKAKELFKNKESTTGKIRTPVV